MSLPAYALNQASFPQMYEHHLVGPLFRPWALALLDEARLREGERALDVACGTGIVARLAQERVGTRGRVAAVDLSAPMLEVARDLSPAVDWREGDAAALPLREGETFDVVFCQQGLQFFGDRAAAAREMLRALGAGGRLAVSTWRPLPEAPIFREAHGIAERLLGPIDDRRHALGDDVELARLVSEAGFDDVRTRKAEKAVRFAEPAAFARLNAMALIGMSGAAKSLGEADRERAIATIAQETLNLAAGYSKGGELVFHTVSNVLTASAPRER
jgi:ubiquinone/menaquinone biosynthesis C-methylase UbiE